MFEVPFPLFVVTYDLREILFMDVSSETYVFLQILFREIHYKILKITWGSYFFSREKESFYSCDGQYLKLPYRHR